MRVAVVDVGTNSVRMLLAEPGASSLRSLERDLVITRLGEGVDRSGVLGEEPQRRTVEAIRRYVDRCRSGGARRMRIAATSAVRDAANRDAFLQAVREATDLVPDVLTGEEEARLGFAGAASALPADRAVLVVDIGGGSTEFIVGRGEAHRWISVDVGSVRLTERHVRSDPPTPSELSAVGRDADAALETVDRAVAPHEAETLVGLAGTITTAAAIALGLPGYDRDAIHRSVLAFERVVEIRERLAVMTSAERRALPAMPRGREDVIVAGILVLERIMGRFGFAECVVSEADILDGLALSLLGEPPATTSP